MKTALPTSKDMRQIYFKQQRKKNILPQHAVLTAELNDEVRTTREVLEKTTDPRLTVVLEKQLRLLLEEKRKTEEAYFDRQAARVTDYILNQPSRIRLARGNDSDREITTLNKRRSTVTLFDRYVAKVMSRSFSVRSHGRDYIIQNVLNTLRMTNGSSEATRSLVRIDIRNFFQEIDHEILKKKINSNHGVPRFASKHVNSLLDAYERLYERKAGLPQGVPCSSVLSEIYLEPLDERLKQHPNIILYVRYVDDILIIADGDTAGAIDKAVDSELSQLRLVRNHQKCDSIAYPSHGNKPADITYLGYQFKFSGRTGQLIGIDISKSKRDRYIGAANNLRKYAGNGVCWNNANNVDLFISAYQYLVEPHYSSGDRDSIRILSGLAFSARYVLKVNSDLKHIKEIFHAIRVGLNPILGTILKAKSGNPGCPCCARPVLRVDDLRFILNRPYRPAKILRMKARPHVDGVLRDQARELLWNS